MSAPDPSILLQGGLAVIGHPIGHTLSPLIHNAALEALGHPPVYEALDVMPAELPGLIDRLAMRYAGVNVTIPHKTAVLPLLDRVTERAAAVGAVNTIVIRRGNTETELVGDNTDVAGFLEPLSGLDLAGCEVVVLGAGGAARAVVYGALATLRPTRLTILARRMEQAVALSRHFADVHPSTRLETGLLEHARALVPSARLVVNTTPVGMDPDVDGTPCPDDTVFRTGQVVYDLVYRPAVTRLLREAHHRGATTIGGLPMLVGQAAAAFKTWTGATMPIDVVLTALERHLSGPDFR